MAIIRLTPTNFSVNRTSNVQLSVSNFENLYSNTDSDSYATVTHNVNSTSNWYIVLNGFDFSAIPSNATVNSFTVKLKARQTGNNTSTASAKPSLVINCSTKIDGTCDFISETETIHTFTGITANWSTLAGYNNSLGIRIDCKRRTASTQAYLYIYGAEIEVNCDLPSYSITSVNNSTSVSSIIPEGITNIIGGQEYKLDVYANNATDFTVEDNGNDVTSQLTQNQRHIKYITSTVLGQYEFTGGAFGEETFEPYFQSIVGNGDTATSNSDINCYADGSDMNALFCYDMSISNIPSNAVIKNVYCRIIGRPENVSAEEQRMSVQLKSGNVALSDEYDFKTVGNASYTQTYTLKTTTIPTLSQLGNMKLHCGIGWYGGQINGATCYVEYEVPTQGSYWQYSLSNIGANHTINVNDAAVPYKSVLYKDNTWNEAEDILKRSNGQWNSIKYERIWIHNGTTWVEDAQRVISTKGIITQLII